MLNAAQIQLASLAVRELRVSISNFFLYSVENAMVKQSLGRLLDSLDRLFQELPSVSFGESEGRLVVEGAPLDERLTGSTNMIKDIFLTHKIRTLTFFKGVAASDIHGLFSLLKPRALPEGASLSQALVEKSLGHIKVNEKVFVALSEGEMVVPGDAALGGEQNLQEALEALQYFLQVFGRVRPETNKQEVTKRLMENMGAWIKPDDFLAAGGGRSAGGNAAAPAPSPQPWRELMASFLALKNVLSSLKTPNQVSEAQVSVDDLLKKLVLLGESQGVQWEEKNEPQAVAPSPASLAPENPTQPLPAPPEQENLFESNPVLAAVQDGDWKILSDPSLEEKVAEKIPFLQEPGSVESFEVFWEKLWGQTFSAAEGAQNLALRHLNRIQWNGLPRPLQLEGLRNLRMLLLRARNPAPFPLLLALTQDWLAQELAAPDWTEVLETTHLLVELSDLNPPYFEGQTLAARTTLETIYCEPVLEGLLGRYEPQEKDSRSFLRLFKELGHRILPFLYQKIELADSSSPLWRHATAVLESLQSAGLEVYETILEWPEKRLQMEKFLEIFQAVEPPGELQDYFERHWNTFSHAAQVKILAVMGRWKKQGFHPVLERLLQNPESPIASEALGTIAQLGVEGDGQLVIEAVQRHSSHGKERENFWIRACQALGALQDDAAAAGLMEWAAKYKFMEQKKGRSLEVRRAAIQALGNFRSETVRDFLASLKGDIEKELKADTEEAFKSVEGNLAAKAGKTEAAP